MADYTYDAGYARSAQRAPRAQRAASGATSGMSMTNMAGAVASLALIVGVGVWGYGVVSRDVSGVPVVQALAGPMRIAPENPGGTLADHQGLAVNAVAGSGSAEGPAQQLLLAPVPAGLAAEDVAATNIEMVEEEVPVPTPAALQQDVPVGLAETDIEADDPILALAAQIAADSEPLTPLADHTPSADSPFANAQDVSSNGAVIDDEIEDAAEVYDGPGLRRSLRPRVRPQGMQVASMGPVDPAVVAAAAATPTREVDAASLPVGTRLVQIGAFDSPETARSEWTRLEARFGDFLDGKGRVIQQAQSGGRTFYRLRAEGFVDLADARRFCAAFVAEKVDCIPVVTR